MMVVKDATFEMLHDEWLEMERKGTIKNPFQTMEWVQIWWRHYGKSPRQPVLLGIYDDRKLVGIAPFFKDRVVFRGRIKLFDYLSPMGSRESSYNGLIFEPEYEKDGISALFDYLSRSYASCIIRLVDIPGSAGVLNQLNGKAPLKIIQKKDAVCPVARLPDTWVEYWNGIGRSTRKKLKWYKNRLDKMSDLTFEKISGYNEKDADDLFALHYARWNMNPANTTLSVLEKFEKDIMKMLADKNQLRMAFLKVGGKRIAGMFMYDYQKTRYYHKGGYDIKSEELSPGTVLLSEVIKDAIGDGLGCFDFLRGDETYKAHFAETAVQIYRITLAKTMWKAMLFDLALRQ